MTDIKIDPTTGEIDVTDYVGPRLWVEGERLAAIAQRIKIRMHTFLGEWFSDQNVGVPWFQEILGAKNAEALATIILRDVLSTTPDVIEIRRFDVSLDGTTRELSVDFEALTNAGPMDSSLLLQLFPAPPLPEQGLTWNDPSSWSPFDVTWNGFPFDGPVIEESFEFVGEWPGTSENPTAPFEEESLVVVESFEIEDDWT